MILFNNRLRINIPIFVFFACDLIQPFLTFVLAPSISSLLCDALIVGCFLWAFLPRLKSTRLIPLLLAAVCLALFFVTGLAHPEYEYVMYEKYNIWRYVFAPRAGIMLMLILSLTNDPQEIFDTLKIAAIPVWLAFTIRTLMGQGLSEESGSNHYYGYAFLFVVIVYTICFFQSKKPRYIAIAAIALFQVLMFASRTALLSYVVFLALYFLFYDNQKPLRGKKLLLIVLGVVLAFFLTSEFFLSAFGNLMDRIGLSSKIINAMLSGENQLDGGRERTYELASKLLLENPWGLGVYWDRYYCEYAYVHNIFYEILIDFGWLPGGLVLLWLLKNIITILRSNENGWKLLLLLFFSLSMIRLTLSYSFWFDNNFWAMIAVILGYRYVMKKRKKTQPVQV